MKQKQYGWRFSVIFSLFGNHPMPGIRVEMIVFLPVRPDCRLLRHKAGMSRRIFLVANHRAPYSLVNEWLIVRLSAEEAADVVRVVSCRQQ
jgi:hypothetical protein